MALACLSNLKSPLSHLVASPISPHGLTSVSLDRTFLPRTPGRSPAVNPAFLACGCQWQSDCAVRTTEDVRAFGEAAPGIASTCQVHGFVSCVQENVFGTLGPIGRTAHFTYNPVLPTWGQVPFYQLPGPCLPCRPLLNDNVEFRSWR